MSARENRHAPPILKAEIFLAIGIDESQLTGFDLDQRASKKTEVFHCLRY